MRLLFACWVAVSWWSLSGVARAETGKVTLPLSTWERLLDEVREADRPRPPAEVVLPIERTLDGTLQKGLFTAKLVARFEVLDADGHVRVPVLDAGASLGDVRLNGQRTSLLREGGMYSVGIDRPGTYRLEAELYWGREQDRFARRLQLRLPEAGVTRLAVLVPELEIEAKLANGVLTKIEPRAGATLLEGFLDPSGALDLSWNRTLSHRARGKVRWQAKQYTVFTVHEALVQGVAAFDLEVLAGEAERVELRLPADIEVVRVEGDAVLQWHTDAAAAGTLAVLFRYLVEKSTRVTVHFQFPADTTQTVALRMPLGPPGVPVVGALGVQGPAGLSVRPVGLSVRPVGLSAGRGDIEAATTRDLPPELTDLTASPLLFGLSFTEPPQLGLAITPLQEVELTTTLIDDLQASTVLNEDGVEVTKLKLRMRNNVRQYLRMTLPPAAILTHSLIDGQPVRPATGVDEHEREVLLLPLRQSERIPEGEERWHEVGAGDTLSDLANFYFSDPGAWRALLEANADQLHEGDELYVGQRLRIPARKGATVQESTFVLEIAYKRGRPPLGVAGRAEVTLPALDVDTVEVAWHLYLPQILEPLVFDTNLVQYSAIRYDPFRRARDFLLQALFAREAWAGGGYQNILSQRRGIFRKEAGREAGGKMILSAFPLVGERYRFAHILIGQQTPRIAFTFLDKDLLPPVRWLAFFAAFAFALVLVQRRRERRTWIAAGVALGLLLLVAYFVLGVHRRMVWGIDLALGVTLLRLRGRALWQRLQSFVREPWRAVVPLTVPKLVLLFAANLALSLLLLFPLLLSTAAAAVLFALWLRATHGAERAEVRHGYA